MLRDPATTHPLPRGGTDFMGPQPEWLATQNHSTPPPAPASCLLRLVRFERGLLPHHGFRTEEAITLALYHNLGALPELELTHRFC